MFGWLPIIGPIIDGIVSIFKGVAGVKVAEIQGTVEEAKTAADIVKTFKDDIGVRLARDLIMFPVAVWTAIATWDTIVAHHNPTLMYTVEKFPDTLAYLPYAVITFLFGLAWINKK